MEADLCTSHVFHQIPGQNRIFMGWYSQGTQVVDFVEHADGTVEFKEAGFFIPTNANQWVSAVFKMRKNGDGTFTYWGATGDFNLGTAGRSAVDIWKVTLPAPPLPFGVKPEPGDSAVGGGWLARTDGKKVNFGFSAKDMGNAVQGSLELNDKGSVKIHIDQLTSLGAVGEGCGEIEDGPTALEFRGTGSFNGVSGKSFRVCVEDGGKIDRFYLACTGATCFYKTDAATPDDVVDGGNINVRRANAATASGTSQPTTLILDPVLASSAPLGQPQLFSVRVFDQRNEPLANASVSLTQTSAGGLQTLTGVTGVGGVATFLATPLAGVTEFTAMAGSAKSNAIELAGI